MQQQLATGVPISKYPSQSHFACPGPTGAQTPPHPNRALQNKAPSQTPNKPSSFGESARAVTWRPIKSTARAFFIERRSDAARRKVFQPRESMNWAARIQCASAIQNSSGKFTTGFAAVLHTARCSHQPGPGADGDRGGPYRGGLHLHWPAACKPGSLPAAATLLLLFRREHATPATTGRPATWRDLRRLLDAAASALSPSAGLSRLRLPLPTGSGFDFAVACWVRVVRRRRNGGVGDGVLLGGFYTARPQQPAVVVRWG